MTYIGLLHYFLGLQVLGLSDGLFLSQYKCVVDLLHHFQMSQCKPFSTPFQSRVKLTEACSTRKLDPTLYQQLLRSLIYLTHSRPDIFLVVSVISQFIQGL
jgi:hypothetical protein